MSSTKKSPAKKAAKKSPAKKANPKSQYSGKAFRTGHDQKNRLVELLPVDKDFFQVRCTDTGFLSEVLVDGDEANEIFDDQINNSH